MALDENFRGPLWGIQGGAVVQREMPGGGGEGGARWQDKEEGGGRGRGQKVWKEDLENQVRIYGI